MIFLCFPHGDSLPDFFEMGCDHVHNILRCFVRDLNQDPLFFKSIVSMTCMSLFGYMSKKGSIQSGQVLTEEFRDFSNMLNMML